MKKLGWHAKAFYVIFALALIVGLTPLTVMAGHATIVMNGPCYAKEGQAVNFTAETNPVATSVDWFVDGVQKGTDTTPPFELLNYIFPQGSAGRHVVSAVGHWGTLVQNATFEILIGVGLIPQLEYNIIGSTATFCVPDLYKGHVAQWRFEPTFYPGSFSIVSGGRPREGMAGGPDDCVTVHSSSWGELVIYADIEQYGSFNATTLMAIKKWGKIYDTWLFGWDYYKHEKIWDAGKTQIFWNENYKKWEGTAKLYDLIIGNFITDGGFEHTAFANGADVEWWVMDANAPVHSLPSGIPAMDWMDTQGWHKGLVTLVNEMQAAHPSRLVGFGDCNTKYVETISGDANIDGFMDGLTGVELVACGPEAVKIVVVAKYPGLLHDSQWLVFPEIISWDFWAGTVEKVPQVRWAGEKIVLEKQFGINYEGNLVGFKLENQSVGTLEGINAEDYSDWQHTVWTRIDDRGVGRCLLTSEAPGEVDVTCMLKSGDSQQDPIINQHGFVVFFLKLEDITLGNVEGEREGHDAGQFTPPNPWKDTEEDPLTGEVDPVDPTDGMYNVSQDALLRARVRGWFVGDDPSNRPARPIDSNNNGVIGDLHDQVLPAGRWVLPDDWPYLAGHDPLSGDDQWMEMRPHWDIMDQPDDNIMSAVDGYQYYDWDLDEWVWAEPVDKAEELGPYFEWDLTGPLAVFGDLVAEAPVIGPYSTLDNYDPEVYYKVLKDLSLVPVVPAGIDYDGSGSAADDGRKTIVRNGKLNWWDCPMPPAEIIFEVTEGPGFFKDADKGDIYYQWVDTDFAPGYESKVYTNPFYMTMIPSSPFIPAISNNGRYLWDSWNPAFGPYPFWDIVNQPEGMTPSDEQHPTKVLVYSDNHGEAMVWFNGDWNLKLGAWLTNGAYDVPTGEIVGASTVVAKADYPYMKKHPWLRSNKVTKIWTWGKSILGADPHRYIDGSYDLGYDPLDPLGSYNTRMVFQTGTLDVDTGMSDKKMAFIWVCDRDGFPVVGEEINWFLADTGGEIAHTTTVPQPPDGGGGVSIYLPYIHVEDGLLRGTTDNPDAAGDDGGVSDDRQRATSFTRLPTEAEKDLFLKFQFFGIYPPELDVNDYAVAAIEVLSSNPYAYDLTIYLHEREGTIIRHTNLDFTVADDPDDPYVSKLTGDANNDETVDVRDMIEAAKAFLQTGTPGWIPADVNKDGVVDVLDLILIGQNFDD